MTNITLRSLDIPSIHKFGIGFDQMFDELLRVTNQQTSNYPPYNIVKHSEDRFSVELAVAGFREGDIKITVEKKVLTVSGEKTQTVDEFEQNVEYLHQGISNRSFTRTWTIADNVEVKGADMSDGILTILLERFIPEDQKPKSIAISYNK